jgi:hypothetical protein
MFMGTQGKERISAEIEYIVEQSVQMATYSRIRFSVVPQTVDTGFQSP